MNVRSEPKEAPVRTAPEWLISDEVEYDERDLGNLKSGKEAEVFIIERSFGGRSCLLAHKRYRPRSASRTRTTS